MMTDPTESLDALPKRSKFEGELCAGGGDPLKVQGDSDLGLGEPTKTGAGVDPEDGGALLDDPHRRSEECDPDEGDRCSLPKNRVNLYLREADSGTDASMPA